MKHKILNAILIFCIAGSWIAKTVGNIHSEKSLTETCFTPGGQCEVFISNRIDQAKSELLVQAYHLTNKKIINAICEAKVRGVTVVLIVDKAAKKELNKITSACYNKAYIDHKKAIAHNKVIIIDNQSVITGSYNFTSAAEQRNAENVLWLNKSGISQQYRNNFFNRIKESYEFQRD